MALEFFNLGKNDAQVAAGIITDDCRLTKSISSSLVDATIPFAGFSFNLEDGETPLHILLECPALE